MKSEMRSEPWIPFSPRLGKRRFSALESRRDAADPALKREIEVKAYLCKVLPRMKVRTEGETTSCSSKR